jgi:hypothetical protein
MYCQIFLRKGIVYVPTMGKMDKGFYREIEPVAVVSASNSEALHQALQAAIARGNPTVPMLRRSEWPPPVTPKYAGLKTWSAFERGMLPWSIEEESGCLRIVGKKRSPDGAWKNDPDQTIIFPSGTAVDAVIKRMTTIVQSAARGSSS